MNFFLYGISYGGKYAPAIGYAIHQYNNKNITNLNKPKINLKGLIIANGLSDPINQINYADYLYQVGLIDSNGRELIMEKQNQITECIENHDLVCAYDIVSLIMLPFALSNETSPRNETIYSRLTGLKDYANIIEPLDLDIPVKFLKKPETLRALHVGNDNYYQPTKVLRYLMTDIMDSVADWLTELLSHYRIMFFNGQLDIVCAYPLTENFLKRLKFSGAEDYKTAKRHIWRVDNYVAGYIKQAGNLNEVLVRNAGHAASLNQPKWILDLLLRFTQYKGFD